MLVLHYPVSVKTEPGIKLNWSQHIHVLNDVGTGTSAPVFKTGHKFKS